MGRQPEAYGFALMISAPAVAVVAKTNPIAANPSGLSTASEWIGGTNNQSYAPATSAGKPSTTRRRPTVWLSANQIANPKTDAHALTTKLTSKNTFNIARCPGSLEPAQATRLGA